MNDSLHFNCWRSFNSLRNARQISNQTLAPPSLAAAAVRSKARETPRANHTSEPRRTESTRCPPALCDRRHAVAPRRRFRRFASKGRIFSYWAPVNSRPYRAIGPPSALLSAVIAHFRQSKHDCFKQLCLKVLQGKFLRRNFPLSR